MDEAPGIADRKTLRKRDRKCFSKVKGAQPDIRLRACCSIVDRLARQGKNRWQEDFCPAVLGENPSRSDF